MAARSTTTKKDKESKPSRLEHWLKIVPLVTATVSGVLALVPQTASFFGPFDYAAETLLGVCAVGIMVFAAGLVREKPSASGSGTLASRRLLGIAVLILAPLLAGLLWYSVLRLSPEKEEMVRKELALGDTELTILKNPARARDHYRNALLIAPRRGSIRAKIQDAEERLRLKGD